MDSKSAACMAKNVKNLEYTRHIYIRVHFVRNGDKWKMHKIEWYEEVLQLAYIATKNVGKNDVNPRMKYIMVSLDNSWITIVQEGW